ncbi:MAG: ribonuclease H family protein [Peptoniphilaceae bacterium]|nr:ribonuclease H family protein [Peptoniphilaceae bacterium]MDY6019654.1 ribonuclease H family protein [Anaerococcus sp.]
MKYYAVRKGKNPGIYTSWDLCKDQVHGYKGAIYKSFTSKKDAENFLESKEEKPQIDEKTAIAYVDGSYKQKDHSYGSGVVYLTEKGGEEFYQRFDDSFSIYRNVAGEVKASALAIKKAIKDGKNKIYIHHDYQGVSSWADGEWKTNNDLTKAYKAFVDRARKKITIHFIKVKGHSNDKYNDLADKLAKKALGIE